MTKDQMRLKAFELENPHSWNLGLLARYAARDIFRNKVHFIISFWSVFLFVLCSLVIKTLIDDSPLIFLKMAESSLGQFDATIFPAMARTEDTSTMHKFKNKGHFINYQNAEAHMQGIGKPVSFAPRKQFCNSRVGSDKPMEHRQNTTGGDLLQQGGWEMVGGQLR